jgi:hypothetical protein
MNENTTLKVRIVSIKDVANFNKRLVGFERATKTSMAAARDCADFALSHFAKCGDLGPSQRFFDSMNTKSTNYTRKGAFAKWFITYANVDPLFVEKKFKKLASKTPLAHVEPGKLEAALSGADWWDYTPEKEDWFYGADDVLALIDRAVKKCESDHSKAVNPSAKQAVAKLKDFSEKLHVELKIA